MNLAPQALQQQEQPLPDAGTVLSVGEGPWRHSKMSLICCLSGTLRAGCVQQLATASLHTA